MDSQRKDQPLSLLPENIRNEIQEKLKNSRYIRTESQDLDYNQDNQFRSYDRDLNSEKYRSISDNYQNEIEFAQPSQSTYRNNPKQNPNYAYDSSRRRTTSHDKGSNSRDHNQDNKSGHFSNYLENQAPKQKKGKSRSRRRDSSTKKLASSDEFTDFYSHDADKVYSKIPPKYYHPPMANRGENIGEVASQRLFHKNIHNSKGALVDNLSDYTDTAKNVSPKQTKNRKNNKNYEMSKEEIWQRLLESKKDKEHEWHKVRTYLEKEEMQENCSFKPKINQYSKAIAEYHQSNRNAYDEDFSDRLYQDAFERMKRKKISTLEQDATNDVYVFQPKLNGMETQQYGFNERPLHERYHDELKRKKENQMYLKQKIDDENHITFQPKINKTSEMVSQRINQGEDVVSRLVNEVAERAEKKLDLIRERNKEQSEQCTFEPYLNRDKNDDLLRGTDGEEQTFLERQYLFQEKKENELLQKRMEADENLFKPKINEISKFLVEGDPTKQKEDLNDKIKRLAVTDLERREQLKKELKLQEQNQYNFMPTINEISNSLAKPKTCEELADTKDTDKKKQEKMKEKDLKEQKQCPFKPKLNKNYKKAESHYSKKNYDKKYMEMVHKKKLHTEYLKQEGEFNEMKECTFQPKMVSTDYENLDRELKQENIVAGFEQYKEYKDNAYKQKLDKVLREQEMYDYSNKYDQRDTTAPTVAEPFKLSKTPGKFFKNTMVQDESKMITKDMFKPHTNEGDTKKHLQKLQKAARQEAITEQDAENE